MPMLHNGLQVNSKCTQLILVINLYVKLHLPLAFSNAKLLAQVSHMCYSKCHNVNKSHLKKLLILKNNIILTISRPGTLRPLGIWFEPFANNICDTKYHKWCSIPQYNSSVHYVKSRPCHFFTHWCSSPNLCECSLRS